MPASIRRWFGCRSRQRRACLHGTPELRRRRRLCLEALLPGHRHHSSKKTRHGHPTPSFFPPPCSPPASAVPGCRLPPSRRGSPSRGRTMCG
jgi:hypothetical protein